jgi:hypothetical protein
MPPRLVAVTSLFAGLLSACGVSADDDGATGGGKGDGYGSCKEDPNYGDGTCQSDLGCGAPDIDCFLTFETDAAAKTWFDAIEIQWAPQRGDAVRSTLAETDPRFVRSRALVDRAWDLYRAQFPLGTLAEKRAALVVIEDPAINAFVIGDPTTGLAGLSVQIQTGLLATTSTDDEVLAVLIHELTHLGKLHVVADGKDRVRKFYVAPDGAEPIGAQQLEHARAKVIGAAWRELAFDAGYYTSEKLGNVPLRGRAGGNIGYYVARLFWDARNTLACTSQVAVLEALQNEVGATVSALDHSLTPADDFAARTAGAYAALKACMTPAAYPKSFLQIMAEDWGRTVEEMTAQMTPEDVALVSNKHPVDALLALIDDRRTRMRALEAQFATEMGRPWSALRFFSFEEEADDATVPTFRSAKLEPAALAGFFGSYLGDSAPTCEAAIATQSAPYGVDLLDEHHANCWRIEHLRLLADPSPVTSAPRVIVSDTDTTPIRRTRLPVKKRISDHVIY